MHAKIRSRLNLSLIVAAFGVITALHGAPPPVKDFVRPPEISEVSISSDGRVVVFLTPNKDRYFDLNVYDLQSKESKKFDLKGDEVQSYFWIDENRLVLTIQNLPRYSNRQVVFDLKRGEATANLTYAGQYFTLLSSLHRDDPDLFLARFYEERKFSGGSAGIAVINTRLRPSYSAGRENVRFNVQEWIKVPPGELHDTITDVQGELRLVLIYEDKQLHYYYRASPKADWVLLKIDPDTTTVIGVTNDPDFLYLARYSAEAKTSRLHRYRISTDDYGPVLFEDSDYSISSARLYVLRQSGGKVLPLFLSYQRDLPVQRPIHPTFATVMEAVNKNFPGRLNRVWGGDSALRHFVIGSTNGREPERFAIYDHQTGEYLALPAPTPWFKPAEMSVQRPIKYAARDGLILEGYLSLPAPRADGAKPPLVVYPHGGPWVRDTWGFNAEVQFLTSRGYAVFQPNYRGSIGYGKAVSLDENFEFRKMHDDVTDGVKYVVSQGKVDGQRLAIYGGSFGGYLALCGAAFEPGMYRCAITFAGVFDWKQLITQRRRESDDDAYNYDLLMNNLGDPAKEAARFEAMSPIGHVAAIKCPVFVIHGKLDFTVDSEQSTKLLRKLAASKISSEKLFFDTEFHGISDPENYEKFLTAVEKFLAKNL